MVRSAEEIAADPSLAPCQEEVHLATDPDFDLRALLPAPTNTPVDAGPYFCLGLLHGTDPETGHSDVTIHRICVQGRDELSIFLAPGRHIDAFRAKAEAAGEPLPITINMGLDPAITIGACFEAPTTPFGYDGPANPSLPVMRVTAVTTRKDPILHTLVGPGEEHTSLAGIPTEASLLHALDDALPGLVTQVYAHTAGGGKFLAVLQVRKTKDLDDGRARYYHELKNVILVNDDVDVFDSDDVLWAMTTRMVGDTDIVTIPGVSGHVLDPTQQPSYDPRVPTNGVMTKTIYDATYPWRMRDVFERAQFLDVDPEPWLDAAQPYAGSGE